MKKNTKIFLIIGISLILFFTISGMLYYYGPSEDKAIADLKEILKQECGTDKFSVTVQKCHRYRSWIYIWDPPYVEFRFEFSLLAHSQFDIDDSNPLFQKAHSLSQGQTYEFDDSTILYWRKKPFAPWTEFSRGFDIMH